MSSYGVMRGLHFLRPPFTQSKLVRCVKGRVIIIPSFFVDKASCTRQFESELSLHSLASLFPLKEGSTSHPDPLQWSLHPLRFPRLRGTETSGAREETALLGAQNRFALRLADHQRSSPCCAGWDRLAVAGGDLMLHQSPRHGCAGWDRLGKAC